jgi:radical SAM protein with 4Fe4S-binding SPASM domain
MSSAVEPRSYADWSARLHGALAGRRLPVSVTVEVTRRCPLTCSHCYNNLPMADATARREELTTEEHHRLLDQLAEAGCLWLLFTGGEIFARHDFLDIYKHAKGKGFIITLFTNGTLITERIADTLAEWRPFAIEITLYGRTRETYERLTRIPGSYDRCLQGIRLLKERGLPLSLKTVAVAVNHSEVWEMKRFAEEELGVPFKFDAMMTPRIDCSQSPIAVRLTPEEIVELDLSDPGRMREWGEFSREFIRPQQPEGRENEVYHCGGGINSFAIDPLGKMSICVLSHQDEFDLRKGTLAGGWDHFLDRVRRKTITRVTKCTACQLKSVCGMCPANAELESGDPETPVEFLCQVAHLRALTFGWPIPAHGDCEFCPGGSRHEEVAGSSRSLARRMGDGAGPRRRVRLPVVSEQPTGDTAGCGSGCGSCGAY